MRNATLELLGRPPTSEEAATFLADNRPGAYERMVKRLHAIRAAQTRPATAFTTTAPATSPPMTQPATDASTAVPATTHPTTLPATRAGGNTEPSTTQTAPPADALHRPPTSGAAGGVTAAPDIGSAPQMPARLTRCPVLPLPGTTWPIRMLASVAAMFAAAAVVGPIVRRLRPGEMPVLPALTHAHDEPPGASGQHGPSGTADASGANDPPE